MLFNSYIFILLFLPLALLLYYGLNQIKKYELAKAALIGMSLWFYAYFQVSYLLIILSSIGINYLFSRLLEKRKSLLVLGIAVNIGIIFYFKYYNFFLENVGNLFDISFNLHNILMPLGISFITFQQISYLVDSYKGETKQYTLCDYALFVTFFPQLVAGPIVMHGEMIPQFRNVENNRLQSSNLAKGIYLFAIGFGKKVLLADTLGAGVNWGYGNAGALTALETIAVFVFYTLQLYFDFSGYCDMACGIAKMFGITLPINFNSPYKATSINDFWKRWHMSLTRFFRNYVYIPLGGNRKGKWRTIINTMIVFTLSGIWHGANWTFILWGCLHGIALALGRLVRGIGRKIPKCIGWLYTFVFVTVLFGLFRAETIGQFVILLKNILNGKPGGFSTGMLQCFGVLELTYIEEHVTLLQQTVNKFPWLNMCLISGIALIIALFPKNCHQKEFKPTLLNGLGCIVLLVWATLSLSGLSNFLYFNF